MAEKETVLGYGKLFGVLAALLALTAVTVLVSGIDLGVLNIWVSLLVAATKASLVLLFFMHLKYETAMLKAGFVGTIGFLAVLIGFIFWDLAFR